MAGYLEFDWVESMVVHSGLRWVAKMAEKMDEQMVEVSGPWRVVQMVASWVEKQVDKWGFSMDILMVEAREERLATRMDIESADPMVGFLADKMV